MLTDLDGEVVVSGRVEKLLLVGSYPPPIPEQVPASERPHIQGGAALQTRSTSTSPSSFLPLPSLLSVRFRPFESEFLQG